MYGLAGERRLPEMTVPWLPGYEDSKAVRIGNAAASQLQLDVYGEMMDALHQGRKHGLPKHEAAWDVQCALLKHLETCWQEPDEGLWEVRGPRRHFTYSKVMCWVAFDRAIKAVEAYGRPGEARELFERLCRLANDVGVLSEEYDPRSGRHLGNFPQAFSHVALVNTAMNLSQEAKPVEQRAEKKAA